MERGGKERSEGGGGAMKRKGRFLRGLSTSWPCCVASLLNTSQQKPLSASDHLL